MTAGDPDRPAGGGKSPWAALLARLLGVAFLDTDSVIAEAAGKPVGDIFIEDGEEAFRDLERAAVTEAIAGHHGISRSAAGPCSTPAPAVAGRPAGRVPPTGFAAAARRSAWTGPARR